MRRCLLGVAVVVAGVAVAAGCAAASTGTVGSAHVIGGVGPADGVAINGRVIATAVDPKTMVLRLSDLPKGFALDHAYYADNARAAKESKTPLALFVRWGRINGYQADYARDATTGIVQVRSVASNYKSARGAAESQHYSFAEMGPVFTATRIGNEARIYRATLNAEGVTVIAYAVFWRYRTVKAGIVAAGIQGSLRAADAVALAKKQQARIVATTT